MRLQEAIVWSISASMSLRTSWICMVLRFGFLAMARYVVIYVFVTDIPLDQRPRTAVR